MPKLLLLLIFLCAMFWACSSDSSSSLKDWFSDQDIALSYKKDSIIMEIPIKNFKNLSADFDSTFMVESIAVLGSMNGLEHMLYFGLVANDSIKSTWTFKTDSLFYKDFYEGQFPLDKELSARLYWLAETKVESDSSWLQKLGKNWDDSADIVFSWHIRNPLDSFVLNLPDELINLYPSPDSLSLLFGLELLSENVILRMEPPPPSPYDTDIEGLLRVAQRTRVVENCETCLYAGINNSLLISFDIGDELDEALDKTVVFAQIVLPKTDNNPQNEFEHPISIWVYSKLECVNNSCSQIPDSNYRIVLDDYKNDSLYIEDYGLPNLLFWDEGDSLELQVTKALRHYVSAKNLLSDTLGFELMFGNPVLEPRTLHFYTSNSSETKVFSTNPAYAKYDFAGLEGKNAKLRLWLADYGDKK